jgi:hypothetical protein
VSLSELGRKTHKFLVEKASKYYSDKGYTVLKEAKMSGKSRIDLLAIKGSQRIGIECQLTISHKIIKQKFDAYGSSLTRMIFIIPAGRKQKLQDVLEQISKENKIGEEFFEIWMEEIDLTSTLRISSKTKKRLEELGNLSDTYESVIIKLLDEHNKKCKNNGEKK